MTKVETAIGNAAPTLHPRRIPGRFARWVVEKGWAHLVLLTGSAIFLFPFVWMVGTSLKTDDELASDSSVPQIPVFQAKSPYLRETPALAEPAEVDAAVWKKMLPAMHAASEKAITAATRPAGADLVDRAGLDRAAAALLINTAAARMNREIWQSGNVDKITAAFDAEMSPAAAANALDDRLARLELKSLQWRSLDVRIFRLFTGREIATQWKVESGAAKLIPGDGDAAILQYDFTAGDTPLVLTADFNLPVAESKLHKLILSYRGDDSWHALAATMQTGPRRWSSDRTTYIAQHRAGSVLFQPPTFEDDTFKPKIWVPLSLVAGANSAPEPQGARATVRFTLSPSHTAQAVAGKVRRNYERAFLSVPFWMYVRNSIALVALTMVGALLSAAFVAYAFARLNWPGRGVAFLLLLATMMLPGQVTMIPQFMIWKQLGWYNTLNPLWVPAWFGTAFFIFLMTQHMRTIPRELEEAARLDGLNAVQTWWYIILPQVKPTLAAIAIMSFMGAWNEFMGPLIYLRDQGKFPLSLGLFGMRIDQGGDWTLIMAGNVLMTLPVIIIFFAFQRYFIQGMTMSGMKG